MQEPVFPRVHRGQRVPLCHPLGRPSADGSKRATVGKHEHLSVFARHTARRLRNGYDRICFSRALRVGWRDRYNHSSPNCAWAEATVAGALGIRLGGPNDYFGQRVEKPWIGDAQRPIAVDDISRTIRLMWVSSTLALALFIAARWLMVGVA